MIKLTAPSGTLVTGVVNGNPSGITVATGITTANVIGIVDGIYQLIPTSIIDNGDVVIFCGMDTFRKYTVALKNLNLFNYAAEATDFEIIIAGTNVKLVAVNGLNGTNKLWASRLSNLYVGVDLLNEEDRFELFYAKEADEMRFVAEFKYSVNYAFPTEVVYFALA